MTRARSNAVIGAVKAGDIMIKHRHGLGATGIAIKIGQLFSRGKSDFIHAGIASSPTTIIEMDGDGLQENNLLTKNANYSYDVFRCTTPGIGEGAAQTAIMMRQGIVGGGFAQGGTTQMPYTIGGAVKSLGRGGGVQSTDRINTLLDQLMAGGREAFFCSGHVVYCYLVAMEQSNIAVQGSFPLQNMQAVFGMEARYYNPSFLHHHLSNNQHFRRVGKVKGAVLV
ncbi:hypothetical protein F1643_09890 [Azospirillum sp. INR13]|uniref:hypothetical protein n=1 Tax=unclassified Azospirillum TaxID=2630922 RepID=UPI0011EF33C2|nr:MULTISPECIES: hypothetical protein [unclassified Azospirillum]KAA0577028.1 hypothetical protein FZ983_22760 [Azospirillum sp. B21]MBF5094743.1 hypothetical protein [Azospirillum sp. INR13]